MQSFNLHTSIHFGADALSRLAELEYKKAFIIADCNTYPIAGEKVEKILEAAGIACKTYIFPEKRVIPNEKTVGGLVMGFDKSCDVIIGVGSGVIKIGRAHV